MRSLAWFTICLTAGLYAQSNGKTIFELFPGDRKCVCIRTRSETPRLISKERRVGNRIFQVFSDRKTSQELFRIEVGRRIDKEDVKFWNYGIAAQGDFNGDGVEDYSWYGGDDTSDEKFLILSAETAYRKVDIYATFAREWTRRYRTKAPDFRDGGNDWYLRDEMIELVEGLPILSSKPSSRLQPTGPVRTLRVEPNNFVFAQ
jgi:hypothetical protein